MATKSFIKGNRPESVIARQDAFLKAFTVLGTISHSAKAIGITRQAVQKWLSQDTEGFRERWVEANLDWRDNLEHHAWERVQQQKPDSNPTLLIAMLNANLSDKYRLNTSNASDEQKETMDILRQAAQAELANQPPTETIEAITIEQETEEKLQEKLNGHTNNPTP